MWNHTFPSNKKLKNCEIVALRNPRVEMCTTDPRDKLPQINKNIDS